MHNLESLRAEAEKRGLSSAENDLECLQVRLADSVSAETQLSLDEDAVLVCKSLVDLMADGGFRRLCRVRPRSLWQLDATSMSQVLAHRKLDVDSESAVMDVVCKWALHPGRSIEVVDKVMPLVRFPLIDSLLHRPLPPLGGVQFLEGISTAARPPAHVGERRLGEGGRLGIESRQHRSGQCWRCCALVSAWASFPKAGRQTGAGFNQANSSASR